MKAVIILMLLIVTVYCLPVKRSASSSESSEEGVVVPQPTPFLIKAHFELVEAEPTQTTESDESMEDADDTVDSNSSESESGETQTTSIPSTVEPTLGSTVEPTLGPIINTGRGDSLGYPSDYKKSIVYVDAKDIEKIPSPYKSYSSDKLGGLTIVSKKMSSYDDQRVNDVEKEIKLFKALQVHDVLPEEEDTSTPEVENTASGTDKDMEPSDRHTALGSHEITPARNQGSEIAQEGSDSEGASAGESPSTSASTSQEETEQSDGSLSSEETTKTPGAADSENDSSQSTESQESDSDEEITQTTEVTVVIAK
ncbi:uncharacterized protein LOC127636960 [Xyrauchen texanus]|uniref:uncharacterized protein LOC127636960 n=1 Tax=Xyrauchen texanus TaxID=154827 RepID=UPI0022425F72|nr:uncharacterized protein LOC127636960 [Xyrauchen texanus]